MTTFIPQTVTIDPALLDPNPFQPKTRLTFTPDQLSDLSSIADLGFIQRPQVRMHSTQPGRYQIKVGHRRCAAWQLYRPGQPITVDLIVADDRAMFEHMIVENLRTDPTPVERAVMIRDYMQRFSVTQAQAAPLFGLKNQASVSNLLKLLALPVDVQPLVNDMQVPQRIARSLIAPARVAPKEIMKIAQAIAAADDKDKEDIAENELRRVMDTHAYRIGYHDFKVDWQSGPLTIDGQTETPPDCVHCDLHANVGQVDYCTRKACHAAKVKAYPLSELQRISKKFGIPIAAPGDNSVRLDISDHNESRAQAMLTVKKRPEHLRLMLAEKNYHIGSMSRILGSDFVWLASTDKHAIDDRKKKSADEPKPDRSTETPAARAKRVAAEEAQAEQRREERSALRRARADVTWLMQQLTIDTAAQLKIEGGILEIAAQDVAHSTHTPVDWVELGDFAQSIHAHKDDQTRKQYIAYKLLLRQIYAYDTAKTFSWSRATSHAEAVVTRDLGLKLLPGWNKPPIHRTPGNCWACGKFTPGSTITGVDRANGWTVSGNDGSVACSDPCREKLLAAPSPASAGEGRGRGKSKPAKKGTQQ